MTETTIDPALRGADAVDGVDIRIEDDASPIVRLIARTIGDSLRADGSLVPAGLTGAIAIRSHDTPQAATITLADGAIAVSGGVFVEPDLDVTVDLNQFFAPVGEPVGSPEFAAVALALLSPPLPDWKTAARSFWDKARSVPGIPDVLVAVIEGPDGVDQVVVGEGDSHYVIAGPPDLLAAVFTGAVDLLAALSTGLMGVRGTLSQLSVLVAASWKVRYDV
ncbi:hypothetical protein [Nocardia cyriacigeorgica]|uniref:hypothetical protein n=1 Tax=Nocardia cyriacigeorgica TaxID=135487 RepID=UPI0002E131D1|nr:hypothetical protein [Nocardia cyriacigeorgica]AVH23589.1 hypothetical protein C5B73_21305 [Nocardia cyriacigeorgica]MBF6323189.1 hypothetical protein [Nocardia cyriacigeorgica]PPJ15187.1 hypothetical protein C5E43_06805 [Nocardia cyriacigeorgica]TLF55740.1 hypothetical protein FEK31_19270 [Nocardia cyriacigeorgica]